MTDGNTQVRAALDEVMKAEEIGRRINSAYHIKIAHLHLLREISDQLHLIREDLHIIALNGIPRGETS